nr:inositol polyphosphate 5-phosphatase [Polyrhizophydium stewartii]
MSDEPHGQTGGSDSERARRGPVGAARLLGRRGSGAAAASAAASAAADAAADAAAAAVSSAAAGRHRGAVSPLDEAGDGRGGDAPRRASIADSVASSESEASEPAAGTAGTVGDVGLRSDERDAAGAARVPASMSAGMLATSGVRLTTQSRPTLPALSRHAPADHGRIDADVAPLLFGAGSHTAQVWPYERCHLLVIATQECQKGIDKAAARREWERHLCAFLGDAYRLVRGEGLGGVHLAVFVRADVAAHVHAADSGRVATGIGNVLTNKGSAAICVMFDTKSLLFVGSHFAAHQSKVEARNRDYDRTETDLSVGTSWRSGAAGQSGDSGGAAATVEGGSGDAPRLSQRFDYTFWCGDLNYRINGTRALVDSLLEDGRLEVLINNDQLRNEMRRGRVFQGFHEAPITFMPTYKFDVAPAASGGGGSRPSARMGYDSSRKARIPAWTDRILFRARAEADMAGSGLGQGSRHGSGSGGAAKAIVPIVYDSRMEVEVSDHKPVVGVFAVDCVVPEAGSEDRALLGSGDGLGSAEGDDAEAAAPRSACWCIVQ